MTKFINNTVFPFFKKGTENVIHLINHLFYSVVCFCLFFRVFYISQINIFPSSPWILFKLPLAHVYPFWGTVDSQIQYVAFYQMLYLCLKTKSVWSGQQASVVLLR